MIYAAGFGTVSSEKKLTEGTNGFGETLDSSDFFGTSVGRIGDLDGDGVEDIVVGAWGDDDVGAQAGAIYVIFMNSDGTVDSTQKIPKAGSGFTGPVAANDNFGFSVAGIGDLDDDGVEDIVVGSPDDGAGVTGASTDSGVIFILFMNSDGTVKSEKRLSEADSGSISLSATDEFGKSLAGLGDLDGDNVEDIIVGSDNASGFFVLFLNTDGSIKSVSSFDVGTTDAVANIGDLDDDGVIDLAVDLGNSIRILFMNTDGTVKSTADIGDGQLINSPLDAGDGFGSSVAGLGDLDLDGVEDIAVGAPGDDDGGEGRGAVYVLFLNSDGSVKSQQKISDTEGDLTSALANSDLFGSSVVKIEDLNNGIATLAVGAEGTSTNEGVVYILDISGATPSSKISGGYHCSDCSPPTLGLDSNDKRVVDYGFSYNKIPVQVEKTFTQFPLQSIHIGKENLAEIVIYENRGPIHLMHVGLAFGLSYGQSFSESQSAIIWEKSFKGTETVTQIDPTDSIDDSSLRVQSSIVPCLVDDFSSIKCTKLEIYHKFRTKLDSTMIVTDLWDDRRNAWQNKFNHGIHIVGESLNPPIHHVVPDKRVITTIVEIDKNKAIDKNGNVWLYDKSWQKMHVTKGKIDDGVTMHLFDRDHARFESYKKGQEMLAKATLMQMNPKYFDEPFQEINDIKLSPYTDQKKKDRIDEKLQNDIQKEIAKAEKKYHYLYDKLDRHQGK